MRGHFIVAIAALLGTACSHPSSTPAGSSASAAIVPGEQNPCAIAGTCVVRIEITPDITGRLSDEGMSFRAYAGCPSRLGFRDDSRVPFSISRVGSGAPASTMTTKRNETMRGAAAIARSTDVQIVIPSMAGHVVTVGIFFRGDGSKYAVADLGASTAGSVTFGYSFNSGVIIDDRDADNRNRILEGRICP